LLALVNEGATIVLQGLHRYWPPLTELVAALERELGHPGQANAYLTPAGSQGFAPHVDAHDVFVVQTAGEKVWEIGPEGEESTLAMRPGTVLYLPTNSRHSARAQDTLSLHVTIGIQQQTWRDLARTAVLAALDEVPDTHLPAGHLDDPELLAGPLRAHLDAVAKRVADTDTEALVGDHQSAFLTSRPPRLSGLLSEALLSEVINDDTVLRRRATNPAVVVDRPDGTLRLLLGDRTLDLPARLTDRLRPALATLLGAHSFTPADLSQHLDDQSRIVLCRRLIREGLLVRER
jgi:ribosomal protein L16 Arg81 hydroxylase